METLASREVAIPATLTRCSTGTSLSQWSTTNPSSSPIAFLSINSRFSIEVSWSFTKYFKSFVIVTETFWITIVEDLLDDFFI